ncbi:endoplasmic reticulum resident protein 44-like isoform X2 [Limulus polyphemus]|uniref:Endoplasmic reticulum resident protein 44-like isoform X2 n=1 Tax=Limulus polyphemus TaxID=6850 RepID=A0ABM1RYJ1_LIMPO|nr:endoplasmic reticulum resident protein 44-like isoform X2 [Limulus polyphemus]
MEALYILFLFINLFCTFNSVSSKVVQLTSENLDNYLGSYELVFINFYTDWCKFSQILAPIFDEAADRVTNEIQDHGKVLLGKVDCDAECIFYHWIYLSLASIAARFHITKYPTLKLLKNGKLMKKEYRGQRSAKAMVEHIQNLLKDPVKEIKDPSDLDNIQEDKRTGILYIISKDQQEYEVFRKVAMDLRDDCQFFVVTGELTRSQPSGHRRIVFKPARSKLGDNDELYPTLDMRYDELSAWMTNHCIPLVREITFENAEELTEEGLPFLILFHRHDDRESVKTYTAEVLSQLSADKGSINILTADGHRFTHPLHHLGKTQTDLPLIAIDSFRHMYLFPNFKDIIVPGKIKQFVDDLYSGKLHREFHYGPESTTRSQSDESLGISQKIQSDPPESSFKKLAPSRNRYTLLRDEL